MGKKLKSKPNKQGRPLVKNKKPNKGIAKAISFAGNSQRNLADLCGVEQPTISQWLYHKQLNVERAILIEQVTNGEVSRYDIRPDLLKNKTGE